MATTAEVHAHPEGMKRRKTSRDPRGGPSRSVTAVGTKLAGLFVRAMSTPYRHIRRRRSLLSMAQTIYGRQQRAMRKDLDHMLVPGFDLPRQHLRGDPPFNDELV